jgi:hypothetical protein
MLDKLTTDSEGNKSLTACMLKITFIVALIKILIAGLKVKGIEFGEFSATDFGTMLAPMITLYWGRRNMRFGEGNKPKES